ncbi:MAG: hypothetical protein JWO36_4033 [Myxococcales bacterium]|nr:hypothetical protein [Myxococcales bacterium]
MRGRELVLIAALIGCGPSTKAHHAVDAAIDADDFAAFQTCDSTWGLPATATCQTPCVDMSNLGEDVACTATFKGATVTCDPTTQVTLPGRHGCCYIDPAGDPNHVVFIDCQ